MSFAINIHGTKFCPIPLPVWSRYNLLPVKGWWSLGR